MPRIALLVHFANMVKRFSGYVQYSMHQVQYKLSHDLQPCLTVRIEIHKRICKSLYYWHLSSFLYLEFGLLSTMIDVQTMHYFWKQLNYIPVKPNLSDQRSLEVFLLNFDEKLVQLLRHEQGNIFFHRSRAFPWDIFPKSSICSLPLISKLERGETFEFHYLSYNHTALPEKWEKISCQF